MSRISSITGGLLVGLMLVGGCADAPTSPLQAGSAAARDLLASQDAEATSYSGQGTVVNATVPLLGTVVLGDTGPLPESGGALEQSLLEVAVPDLLTATAGRSATVGQGNRAHSEASVAELELTVAGHVITASFLGAEATALCNKDGTVTLTGESHIAELRIDDVAVDVSGAPNQRIELPSGVVIVINEQETTRDGDYGAITVNALHVAAPGVDVVIASAHADIKCNAGHSCSASNGDFVTGGGWINAHSGGRGTFGVGGGLKNDGLWNAAGGQYPAPRKAL